MAKENSKKWWKTALLLLLPLGFVIVILNSIFGESLTDFMHGFWVGFGSTMIFISAVYQVWSMAKGVNPYKKSKQ